MPSLQVKPDKLNQVAEVRKELSIKRGWNLLDDRWLALISQFFEILDEPLQQSKIKKKEAITISDSTWKRFFKGEPVTVENFHAICKALEINWQDVAAPLKQAKKFSTHRLLNSDNSKIIAILPLEYTKTGNLDNILADGFCNGIIRGLSHLSGLRIISTDLTRSYFEAKLPVLEIGRQLRADMIVVGSIQEWSGKFQPTIKLIDVESGRVIWINQNLGYTTLAKAQNDAINSIAENLAIHLTLTDKTALIQRNLVHPIAYEHYVRASGLYTTNNREDLENALSHLDDAIQIDSNFADAYALKGYALWRKYFSGWDADIESLRKALTVAKKALTLNPVSVTATMALIRIYWDFGELEKALEQGKYAVRLAPGSNEAIIAMARAYNNAGMADCSLPLVLHVLKTDPTNPTGKKLLIWNYVMTEKYSEACKEAERHFKRHLIDANTSWACAVAYLYLRKFQEAIDIVQKGLFADSQNFTLWCLYGYIYKLQNNEASALKVWRDGAETLSNTLHVKNYRARVWLALIYAAMSERDDARYRERAIEEVSLVKQASLKNGYLLYRLANVYSELEMFESALSSLKNAIKFGFTSIQMMRCEELLYMKKISMRSEYQSLATNLEARVDELKKLFKVTID